MDGTAFGRYRLIELLGRGGMGEVWQAHDTHTDRVVAIELLPAHLSEDEEFQRRFRREARAAARLNDPHVIPIHNYGEIDGRRCPTAPRPRRRSDRWRRNGFQLGLRRQE